MSVTRRFTSPYAVASCILVLSSTVASTVPSHQTGPSHTHSSSPAVKLVIWADHMKFSEKQSVRLSASLQNDGDTPVYVDRRMFWTGFGGGLTLQISDAQGRSIPVRVLSDAIMPPPPPGDTTILLRLDEGFFYGTSLSLSVKDVFPKPGRYAIRVVYKSWLPKDLVAPELRNLPAMWADSPAIASDQLWVDVTGS